MDAAIEVHRALGGPGLLESVYEKALCWELEHRGLAVLRPGSVDIRYKGHTLTTPLRVDMLVGDCVIVEAKAPFAYSPLYESQALTYLRLTDLKLALAIRSGERTVKDGIHGVANRQ